MDFLKEIWYTLQIERTEVDSFKKGKRIPSCQLIAESETERPTTLKHLVTLSGAKDPHNTFTIYRQCDSGTLYNICIAQERGLYTLHTEGWRPEALYIQYRVYNLG